MLGPSIVLAAAMAAMAAPAMVAASVEEDTATLVATGGVKAERPKKLTNETIIQRSTAPPDRVVPEPPRIHAIRLGWRSACRPAHSGLDGTSSRPDVVEKLPGGGRLSAT